MNELNRYYPADLVSRLNERDRIYAEAQLARAEALVDFWFAVGRGLKRLGAAIARPYIAATRDRTRDWPHPQAR